MGVNMVGNCIIDDEVVREASRQEIIRRYYDAKCNVLQGKAKSDEVYKIELLMKQTGCSTADRKVTVPPVEYEQRTHQPVSAVELPDGRIVCGKTSPLLGACSAMLLNALKVLAGIPDEVLLIPPQVIEPVQDLKVNHLGNRNPRLHTDEVLLALAISAVGDANAKLALDQIKNLAGSEVHSTVILSQVDQSVLKNLGLNLTSEPKYQSKNLYRK